ncbi:MAG: pyrimidine utilization protein A [Synechococcales cyanobacterium]
MRHLELGIFIPIANNGWIISKHSPQYQPTFDLNKSITLRAEQYGFEFVLSMIKWRGFGGETQFWDYALESFTLMAGLAAVTQRIGLYASVALPTLHPAVVARMCATIDAISHGRFGLNIVTGWNKLEYSQMGLWPGDDYYKTRYDYATEYVQILKRLWREGRVTHEGRYFQLQDCYCQPLPSREIPIVCAGHSERGMQFTIELGNHNFILGTIPEADAISTRLKQLAQGSGRQVGTYALFTVVLGDSDAQAQATATYFMEGGDIPALMGWKGAANTDPNGVNVKQYQAEAFMGIPTIIGSAATVAATLNHIAQDTSIDGILLTFPDFEADLDRFAAEVMPQLTCRVQERMGARPFVAAAS